MIWIKRSINGCVYSIITVLTWGNLCHHGYCQLVRWFVHPSNPNLIPLQSCGFIISSPSFLLCSRQKRSVLISRFQACQVTSWLNSNVMCSNVNKREVGLENAKTKRSRKTKNEALGPETRGNTGGEHRVASRRKTEQNGPGHEGEKRLYTRTH